MEKEHYSTNKEETSLEALKEIARTTIDEKYDFVAYAASDDDKESFLCLVFQDRNSKTDMINLATLYERGDDALLVPEITFQATADDFGADPKTGVVSIPLRAMGDMREIFSIFHEIGHLNVDNKKMKQYARQLVALQMGHDPAGVAKWYLQKERDAWAEAIRLAKTLKKDYTINLFHLFEDTRAFMGWLRASGLRSYELKVLFAGEKDAFTKEALVAEYVKKHTSHEIEKQRKEYEALFSKEQSF